ncbi:hypothetical protein CfE428DRAFT_4190 [Chthoniobacter flavus Ellin428]|uniref:Uncharacterized protein n=1 Tax=Chthoniobacter flavus Ellin428 TaxID=497964 RepID=B4D5K1_9BACT|nr:hypothetical protein CfE428DRAFT_4190 [Chthoniobacter flavus Ellin428]TCO90886.1 hypothetical protein EV701_10935 [Chthoniobacter flavus]
MLEENPRAIPLQRRCRQVTFARPAPAKEQQEIAASTLARPSYISRSPPPPPARPRTRHNLPVLRDPRQRRVADRFTESRRRLVRDQQRVQAVRVAAIQNVRQHPHLQPLIFASFRGSARQNRANASASTARASAPVPFSSIQFHSIPFSSIPFRSIPSFLLRHLADSRVTAGCHPPDSPMPSPPSSPLPKAPGSSSRTFQTAHRPPRCQLHCPPSSPPIPSRSDMRRPIPLLNPGTALTLTTPTNPIRILSNPVQSPPFSSEGKLLAAEESNLDRVIAGPPQNYTAAANDVSAPQ